MTSLNKNTTTSFLLGISFVVASFYDGVGVDIVMLPLIWSLFFILLLLHQTSFNNLSIRLPNDKISIIMFFFIAWIIFIYQFSPVKMVSYSIAWELAVLPVIFIIWKVLTDKKETWSLLWPYLFLLGLVTALYGLHDLYIVYSQGTHPYINGQRFDPNNYATILLAILIPAAYYFSVAKDSRNLLRIHPLIQAIVIYLMIVAMLISDSRAVLLIWVTLQIMLLLYLIKAKLLSRKLLYYCIIVIVSFATYSELKTVLGSQYDFSNIVSSEGSVFGIRLMIWESTLQMYLQSPFFGTGLGTFRSLYPAFRNPAETGTSGDSAHNDYIQFLQEGGPLHLLFLILLVLIVIFLLVKFFFSKTQKASQRFIDGENFSLLLVSLGLAVEAFVNFTFSVSILIMFFGLYMAKATDNFTQKNMLSIKLHRPILTKSLLIIVFSVPWSLLLLDAIIDNIYQKNRFEVTRVFKLNDPTFRYHLANFASVARPHNPTPKLALLNHYKGMLGNETNENVATILQKEIETIYQDLSDSLPYNSLPLRLHGNYKYSTGAYEKAKSSYLLALSRNPWDIYTYVALAKNYQAQGDYDKAISLLLNEAKQAIKIASQQYNRPMRIPLMHGALEIAKSEGRTADIKTFSDIIKKLDSNFKYTEGNP